MNLNQSEIQLLLHSNVFDKHDIVPIWFACEARAIFHFLNRLSVVVVVVVGHLRTSDDNDLEHVMNTDSSLETGPFATFRPPPTFYNLFKLFFYIDE